MNSAQNNSSGGAPAMLKPLLFGLLAGIIASMLALMLFAAVFVSQGLPDSAAMPLAISSMCIGAFLGGFVTAKSYGVNGLLAGGLSGLLFFLILYASGAVMKQINLGTLALVKVLASVLCGCIGGILGVNSSPKRKSAR